MKISIFIALLISMILTGCFKGEGQVRIDSNIQNAIIYIDGDKKGMTGDGYTTIILEEGDHEVRIYKEKDEEWFYEGTQNIFVGTNSSVKIKIDTDKKPTEFRLERLKKKKKERLARLKEVEERLAREKKERLARLKIENKEWELRLVKKFGLSTYPIGIYLDENTKLMWQDNDDAKNIALKWISAKEYCTKLTINEYTDWFLPSKKQLLDLYMQKDKLKNLTFTKYWSSSENTSYSTDAWYIYFDISATANDTKSYSYNVRCVREGQ